jgi:hypothetical protein
MAHQHTYSKARHLRPRLQHQWFTWSAKAKSNMQLSHAQALIALAPLFFLLFLLHLRLKCCQVCLVAAPLFLSTRSCSSSLLQAAAAAAAASMIAV